MNEAEIARLPKEDLRKRLDRAYQRMAKAGAHHVVDAVAERAADYRPDQLPFDRRGTALTSSFLSRITMLMTENGEIHSLIASRQPWHGLTRDFYHDSALSP